MSYDDDVLSKEKRIMELEKENEVLRKRLESLPDNKSIEWNQRWQTIIDFIKKNPGTNKEEIIKKTTKEKKGVRVTIRKDIEYLTNLGFISSRKDDKKKSVYNLYINEIELDKLIDVYERFEKSFINLIEKIRPKIFSDELFTMQQQEPHNQDQKKERLTFIHGILLIYTHFLAMNIIHAIYNWPQNVKDYEKRIKLNAILFEKLQNLHSSLLQSLSYTSEKYHGNKIGISIEENTILYWFRLTPYYLKFFAESAKKYDVVTEMENVLDISWSASYNFLPFAKMLFDKEVHENINNNSITEWTKQKWRPISWKEALKYHEKGFLDSELDKLTNKGLELINLRKEEEAMKYFDKVLSIDSENIHALNNKGYLLNKIGRYDDALVYLDKVLSKDPNYVHAWINKGNSLSYLNKQNEAIKCYDKALDINPKDFNALNNKGYELLQKGDFIQAKKYLDKAFKIESNNPLILKSKGLYHEKRKEYEEALRYYNNLLTIKPDNVDALLCKGRILCEIDKKKESILVFEKVLDIDPKNIHGYNNMGIYLLKHGENEKDYEEALRYFDKALSIDPQYFEIWNNKGSCIMRFKKTREDYQEAIRCFDMALKFKPEEPEIIFRKGVTYKLMDKYDEAINCFDRVLTKNPSNKNALLYKAETLLELKKYEEAFEIFNKISSIDSSNKLAKEGVNKAKERMKK